MNFHVIKQPNFPVMKSTSGASMNFHVNKEPNFLVKGSMIGINMKFCESRTILHVILSYFHEKKKMFSFMEELRIIFHEDEISI